MPTDIHRNEVRHMLEEGTQLVEVLSANEYEQEHIRGAINIPIRQLDKETVSQLDRDRPVIVYCHDYQ